MKATHFEIQQESILLSSNAAISSVPLSNLLFENCSSQAFYYSSNFSFSSSDIKFKCLTPIFAKPWHHLKALF